MIVVVGEALVDVGPEGETVGGSPLNVAVGLGRLEVPVVLVTELGSDARAEKIAHAVRASGVELDSSAAPHGRTSTAVVTYDDGEASYEIDLTWDLPHRTLPECDALHVGSLGAVLEPGRTSVLDLVEQAWATEVFVSYDPNVRFGGPEAWRDVEALADRAQLVKLSDRDVELLHPGADPAEVARALLAGDRTELVVLTHGADGASAYGERAEAHVPAPRIRVVDTVGAGDTFTAAVLAVLLEAGALGSHGGGLPTDVAGLAGLLRAATEAAALSCRRRGAAMPWRSELPPGWPAPPG